MAKNHNDCGCDCRNEEHTNEEHTKESKNQIALKLVGGGFFLAVGFVLSELCENGIINLSEFSYLIFFLISYLIIGFDIVKDAILKMINGSVFNENLLMSIASIGAVAIGEYSEGCMVVFLFTLGEYLQSSAIEKSRNSINNMLKSKAGQAKIPNSQNQMQDGGANSQKFITRFARIYTPAVCALAALIMFIPPLFFGGSLKEWVYRGLSVLVVSCPCALVISIPLAFFAGIGVCSKNEIFIKDSNHLESLANSHAAIIDGTALQSSSPKEAKAAIKKLRISGVKYIAVIFDGEKDTDAQNIQKEFDIDECCLNPTDKEKTALAQKLKNEYKGVIYVGAQSADGNLLKNSNIGILLSAALDEAEKADAIIADGSLSKLAAGKRSAAKALAISRENIIFSIATKLIILVGCAVGILDENAMWLAVFGDTGVCLIAIANSLRAFKYRGS